MSDFSWIITIASITGGIANAYKKRWGFAIWILTNAFWFTYDMRNELYSQAILYVVYFATAVIGFVRWGKPKTKKTKHKKMHTTFTSDDATTENDYSIWLTEFLYALFPQIFDSKIDRIEVCTKGLEPIVAQRDGNMLSLFHYVNGEIHRCPYICINIDSTIKRAQTISYDYGGQWYKNVNDYIYEGRKKVQTQLNDMTCEWLSFVFEKTNRRKLKMVLDNLKNNRR